jgi:type I restriction enzyme S subunit
VSAFFRTARLSQVADLNPVLAETLADEDQISFVPMSAVSAETASTTTGEDRSYSDVSKGYTPFLDGDLLVAKITPCFENGKIAQARLTHRFGFGSTEFHVVRPRAGHMDARYLLHFLRQKHLRLAGERRMTGSAGQRRVPVGFLADLEVSLPSLSEQRRIADILDRADALRAKRRAALAQLDALIQSIFVDMFGDPATNPKGWGIEPMRDLVREFRYGTSNKSQLVGSPALRIPNVINGIIDLTEIKMVPVEAAEFARLRLVDGDMLFVRTNGNPDFVGRCAVFESSFAAESGFPGDQFVYASYLIRARLLLGKISPIYLREFMLGPEGRRALRSRSKTSAGQYNLNAEGLGAIAVPVPPLVIQREFVRRVTDVEVLRAVHKASLVELDALFASLQHRAFGGEL